MHVGMHVGMKGRYTIEVRDGATEELKRSYACDNMILDAGMDYVGKFPLNYHFLCCQVGSSNVAPAAGQTTLLSWVAGTSESYDNINIPTAVPPDYVTHITWRYRFPLGVAAGNLSEVGVGWGTTGATLFSRALITNASGVPVTISVLPSELLDIYYHLDLYPRVTDYVHIVNIDGVDRTCTNRWSNAGSWTHQAFWSGYLGAVGNFGSASVCSGPIGPITGVPTGVIGSTPTLYEGNIPPYIMGSYYLDWTMTFVPGVGTGTIRSVVFQQNKYAHTQVEFNPPIIKSGRQTLTFIYRVSWGRYVP